MPAATHQLPGLVTVEHWLDVPVDHERPDGAALRLFAREVRQPGAEAEQRPWLVFLQGGPGGRGPRPLTAGGWIGRAVREHRVLLLDQRGTGRSTPMTRQTVPALGDAAAQAEHLRHFRADAIVRDAEAFRRELAGDRPWRVLGQSYGGFCAVSYLSLAPEGLAGVLVTGGLPGLTATADQVYRRTYPRVMARQAAFLQRYPADAERLSRIRDILRSEEVRLPGGDPLTVERLQTLGLMLGMSDGYETLHYLLEDAFVDEAGGRLADVFLQAVQEHTTFGHQPLYAVLHEAAYAQGRTGTRWAAQRVRDGLPAFDPDAADLQLTGEMIYPWMFRDHAELRPLAAAAELLAEPADWPALYRADVLADNRVPVAALIYADDMYVDADLSRQTAGAIRGLRPWVTNEYDHDGLRRDDRVFDRLLELLTGAA